MGVVVGSRIISVAEAEAMVVIITVADRVAEITELVRVVITDPMEGTGIIMEAERMEGMDSLKKDIRIYLFIEKAPKVSVLFYLQYNDFIFSLRPLRFPAFSALLVFQELEKAAPQRTAGNAGG